MVRRGDPRGHLAALVACLSISAPSGIWVGGKRGWYRRSGLATLDVACCKCVDGCSSPCRWDCMPRSLPLQRPGVIEAFAVFGAKLDDEDFAYSAVAPDGIVVVSCWEHLLIWGDHGCSYVGYLSRRIENPIGNALLARHLQVAWEGARALRLVVVHAESPAKVDRAENLDQMRKTYRAVPDLVGTLVNFNGNDYEYAFGARR